MKKHNIKSKIIKFLSIFISLLFLITALNFSLIGNEKFKNIKHFLNEIDVINSAVSYTSIIRTKGYESNMQELEQESEVVTDTVTHQASWDTYASPFDKKLNKICYEMGIKAKWLRAVIKFETAFTMSHKIQNPKSGATGLIQFMPSTAIDLGTDTAMLKRMSAIKQLDFVEKYFSQKRFNGKLNEFTDLYLAVLYPASVGKADGYILGKGNQIDSIAAKNWLFDKNKDKKITVGEVKAYLYKTMPEMKVKNKKKVIKTSLKKTLKLLKYKNTVTSHFSINRNAEITQDYSIYDSELLIIALQIDDTITNWQYLSLVNLISKIKQKFPDIEIESSINIDIPKLQLITTENHWLKLFLA